MNWKLERGQLKHQEYDGWNSERAAIAYGQQL